MEKANGVYLVPIKVNGLNNKLKLIDFYLEIRNALINKADLNFKFSKDEDQSKTLKFINISDKYF